MIPLGRKGLLVGLFLAAGLLTTLLVGWQFRAVEPALAPEAERILQAQANLPFQVLIPAYLPAKFNRATVDIRTDQGGGPQQEALIQLIYTSRTGDKLVLSEWLPSRSAEQEQVAEPSGRMVHGMHMCQCICRLHMLSNSPHHFMVDIGPLRVAVKMSSAQALTLAQLQAVLDTLGPAANLAIYTSLKEVPLTYSLPPAVPVPINDSGVQELVLVVTANSYTPAHFSVKQGIPVRLIFRQLGQVGCGNELIIQWGAGRKASLILTNPDDKQVLEFTPNQTGVFPFNCPHYIYQGAMTVEE